MSSRSTHINYKRVDLNRINIHEPSFASVINSRKITGIGDDKADTQSVGLETSDNNFELTA